MERVRKEGPLGARVCGRLAVLHAAPHAEELDVAAVARERGEREDVVGVGVTLPLATLAVRCPGRRGQREGEAC
eukprot:476479-Pleurochrysis_carterae.AAC.1